MDTTMRGRRGGEGGERRGWSKERKRMHGRGGEATCENMSWTVEVDYHGDNIIMDGGKWKKKNEESMYQSDDCPNALSTFPPLPLSPFVI